MVSKIIQHKVILYPVFFFILNCNTSQAAREQASNVAAVKADLTSEEEAIESSELLLETSNTKIDAEKDVSEEEIIIDAGNATDVYKCPICDFSSTWKNSLEVHMGRKHRAIQQIAGSTDIEVLEMDEKYGRSEHYWGKGKLGMAHYTFLDANLIIDVCDIPEEEKKKEKEKILDARKAVFGSSFEQFPPWKK